MFPTQIQKSSTGWQIGYNVLVPVALFIWLLPLIAIFMTSIRPETDITSGNVFGWPTDFLLIENYAQVFRETKALQYLINSFLVTVPTVILSVSLACLAGYALAIYKVPFFGKNLSIPLFMLFVAGNFVPFQILMVPVREFSENIGVYNTVWALILFHSAFQTGFCTLFMRNFIKALPFELIESARIEGVGEFKIFWHVVLPLVRPALAALAVLIFTFIWNDFFWATVLTNGDEAKPITAGMESLKGQYLTRYSLYSAAALMAAIPPVIMFFIAQKHFIAGLTLGATKG
ncbi:carbohydrate ABC transporter permease [Pseudahrensia aquimaris]|uniref:sn-glycerol-3-phosphate transport system permease protein UgpE n=1 Tax=Pseudahrensia aquimaris TaxID=744461 RepID=A0ABW3FAW3_9HYPH